MNIEPIFKLKNLLFFLFIEKLRNLDFPSREKLKTKVYITQMIILNR